MQSDISKSSDICFVEVKDCFQQKQSIPMIGVLEYADDGIVDVVVVIEIAVDDVAVIVSGNQRPVIAQLDAERDAEIRPVEIEQRVIDDFVFPIVVGV